MFSRSEDTSHVDLARPREPTQLLNIYYLCKSLTALGRGESGWVSPNSIVYCIPSSEWVPGVPRGDRFLQQQGIETLLGKDRGESPRAGSSALSKASQEPSCDSGETYHLAGLGDDGVSLLSSGNRAIQDQNHSRPVLLSFVVNVTQLYLPCLLLFGSDPLSFR